RDLSKRYKDYMAENRPRKKFLSGMLGSPAIPEMPLSREVVTAAAGQADCAIVTISRQAGEGGDRHLEDDFLLSETEKQMLADVCEVFHGQGKKVVVVLNVGGVVETASWKQLPDAIVLAWQPGQEGGDALASILSGRVCPSGRLPVTFPVDYFDLPSSAHFPYDYVGRGSMTAGRDKEKDVENVGYTDYAEGLDVGYRYFQKSGTPEVSYPFGYGLSYTTFQHSGPVMAGNAITVSVKNTGSVAGKEVVMVMTPLLRAFGKTRLLQPGESVTLVLPIVTE
ncbi:MAG: glycoside hydrolase family 3 C-terminal domain-containing protein, partial [Bacteroidales bacterium]|nr:glycoside hydrolase family 3 C-terminal domain-containing protein [Bacteroidales bacterium]